MTGEHHSFILLIPPETNEESTTRALRQLNPQDQELLFTVSSQNRTCAQIGKHLGLSEGNVKVKVHRARIRHNRIIYIFCRAENYQINQQQHDPFPVKSLGPVPSPGS
ncbi:RNA polymerase sigma factor [uncultured Desulfobacter sp.]|uniref:RNA polymerase sigma factor n=1 Tax=uncultured Desulfobacter sp. TaxID=240139 RepID=UPI0037489999